MTLASVSKELKSRGLIKNSPSLLSKLRSFENIPLKKRTSKSIEERYKSYVNALEKILEIKFGYHYVEDEECYKSPQNPDKPWKLVYHMKEGQKIFPEMSSIYEKLPIDLIKDRFRNARNRIRILDTFLTDIENWKDTFVVAMENGCTIEILLAAPKSDCARLRTKGLKDVSVRSRVEGNLRQLRSLSIKYKEKFKVRLYDQIPGMNIFAFDDTFIVGWFWFHKYAINGPYMVLNSIQDKLLCRDIDGHWDKMWVDVEPAEGEKFFDEDIINYECYYLRDGEPQQFTLSINTETKEVTLRNTPSGVVYKGDVIDLHGYTYIKAQTNHTEGSMQPRINDRIASFLINNSGASDFTNQRVAIAAYTNISPKGRAYCNIMVLVKQENDIDQRPFIMNQDDENLIQTYLLIIGSEISIQDGNVSEIRDLKEIIAKRINEPNMVFMEKLSGDYTLIVENTEKSKKREILTFPMRLDKYGAVKFRGSTDLSSSGEAKILNRQNILISKHASGGETSYFYVIQPVTTELSQLKGYAVGVSRANKPKFIRVFLHKNPNSFDEGTKTFPGEDNMGMLVEKYGAGFGEWLAERKKYF